MVRTKVVLKRLRLRRRAAITVHYKSDSEATSSTMYSIGIPRSARFLSRRTVEVVGFYSRSLSRTVSPDLIRQPENRCEVSGHRTQRNNRGSSPSIVDIDGK
jgi:hypothetical protein